MEMSLELPKIKTMEEGDEVVVRVWISGVEEKDFEFEVGSETLRIHVEKEDEKKIEEEGYYEERWASSSFGGAVRLPHKVVPMISSKSYDGEVLEVRMKKEE